MLPLSMTDKDLCYNTVYNILSCLPVRQAFLFCRNKLRSAGYIKHVVDVDDNRATLPFLTERGIIKRTKLPAGINLFSSEYCPFVLL